MIHNDKSSNTDQAPTTSAFITEVELQLALVLGRSPKSFGQLMQEMEGAFPTDVLSILKRLRHDKHLACVFGEESDEHYITSEDDVSLNAAQSGPCKADHLGPAMPEPHPLDYDWRFASKCFSVFDNLLLRLCSKSVAILGAPTLFLHLFGKGLKPHLYDKNSYLIDQLIEAGFTGVTQCDLFQDKPANEYDVVVADPPWYTEFYCAFIDSAREALKEGGHLLISVLPRLTRPSAAEDRRNILEYAYSKGFDLYEVHHAALLYDSPPFEVAALRAQGVDLADWRSGDLFVFTLTSREPVATLRPRVIDETEWDSFTVGESVVKVRRRNIESLDVAFEPASPAGHLHLHSVSRRSPVRASIDLWTSRNLALKVSRPDYVSDVLFLAKSGITYRDAIVQVSTKNRMSIMNERNLCDLVNLLLKDAGVDSYV
jgi:hypothetical protein